MQAVAGDRDPRLAGEGGANWMNLRSHSSIRAGLQVTPVNDTTPFPCVRPTCIFEMHFPIASEGKACAAGTLVLLGSMGGFVL